MTIDAQDYVLGILRARAAAIRYDIFLSSVVAHEAKEKLQALEETIKWLGSQEVLLKE